MKRGLLFLSCTLIGCFYLGQERYEDILRHPSSEWSSRDCLTIILSVMGNNFIDQTTCIRVMATPFYPAVIAAASRIGQQRTHFDEPSYQHDMDTLLKAEVGLFMDWNKGTLVDSRGNYYRDASQLDSLMFLVTIVNTSTCNIPNVLVGVGSHVQSVPLATPSDWPCYIPDITNLEDRITLLNDRDDTLRPRFVWGKRHNQLTTDETLLIMFPLRNNPRHFLDGSEDMYLILRGFDHDIKLHFPVSEIR